MPKDEASVRVGPSNIKYGGVHIGYTEGETTITVGQEFKDFIPDQSTGPVKDFLIGESVEVAVPMVQWRARDLALVKAIAAGTLKATAAGGGGSTALSADVAAGATLLNVVDAANFDPDDYVLVGSGPKAEIVQVESADITANTITLKSARPCQFAHSSGDAVVEVDISKTRIAMGGKIQDTPTAQLDIEPLDGGETVRIYKAKVKAEWELTLSKSEESIPEITFAGLMDTSRAEGDQLMSIGDQTVT